MPDYPDDDPYSPNGLPPYYIEPSVDTSAISTPTPSDDEFVIQDSPMSDDFDDNWDPYADNSFSESASTISEAVSIVTGVTASTNNQQLVEISPTPTPPPGYFEPNSTNNTRVNFGEFLPGQYVFYLFFHCFLFPLPLLVVDLLIDF
jgi:hypothetical protein